MNYDTLVAKAKENPEIAVGAVAVVATAVFGPIVGGLAVVAVVYAGLPALKDL